MAKLKLGTIAEDKPVKLTADLPSQCSSGPRRLRRTSSLVKPGSQSPIQLSWSPRPPGHGD